jgi:hypothetical protein
MDWRQTALAEANAVKAAFAERHGWAPVVDVGEEAVDLFVRLHGKHLGEKTYLLRLRYLPDWQLAGRRESFVDPDDRSREGREFWPPAAAVRGVNPDYQPDPGAPVMPCVCLRGVYGYHSVLHTNERPDNTTLLRFLLELQGVIDE